MDEVEHFREHGWCVLRGVASAERAEALGREVERVFPQSKQFSDRVHELAGISALSEALAAQVRDATLAARAAAILGCERVQLLQDTALVKPARSEARVEWHQDHTYTGYFDRAAQVSVRLALTDCTEESGCLRVIDGSHRWGPLGEVRAFQSQAVGDDSELLPEGWREREVLLELRPGDLSIHHSLTVHGSRENRSDHPRRTLIARLLDARCVLDKSRLPPHLMPYFPLDAQGHLDPRSFPLL
jgi:ectoine hydroxylase-related dioxygenase (phytanoyl-CoA dioxygenase family)